jgi:cbb3-type cytochrome oxidase subunit 3
MANYIDNIIPKQTQEFIKQNKLIQHLFGFMTLFVLITLLDETIDTRTALIYSLIGYILFIFSTKLDLHWNIALILLLFIGYAYETDNKQQICAIQNDINLTDEQKKRLITERISTQSWIVWSVIILIILGTFFYSQKKQEQYGGSYDVLLYIFN